ncbi:MAG: putative protein N(5)-glutamine methyltransferase [Jatrophihabitantaceae bacterium]
MPVDITAELLASVVGRLRVAGCVFAEDEARLVIEAASTEAELDALVGRRVGGEPLEVIVGWAEFAGLRVLVDAGVFVPRRRTEFLVEQAARRGRPGTVVLDLCCGTGALGLALLATLGRAELHAVDLDPVAVRCARRNLEPTGGRVYHGDLYQPLPVELRGRVELLLVNAPYVPTLEIQFMPAEARLAEPLLALDGGPDGVAVQRRVIAEAPRWLAPGGNLLIETSQRQAALTAAALDQVGLSVEVASSPELDCIAVIGTR